VKKGNKYFVEEGCPLNPNLKLAVNDLLWYNNNKQTQIQIKAKLLDTLENA
jgi:hypothetical protein